MHPSANTSIRAARRGGAQFYAACAFEKIAHVYLRDARYCYLRWGAEDKLRELEQFHPHLREKQTPESAITFGASGVGRVTRLDEDTIEYFKSLAEQNGIPYQDLINLHLRECAEVGKTLTMKWE
jgi:hypothetical protein